MPAILSLVRRDDFTGDIDSVSLLSFTNGFDLVDDGWQQAIDGGADGRVVETLTLMVRGSSHDALATAIQLLDEKIEQINNYGRDAVEIYGVWLRAKMTNETGTRQALIRSAMRSPVPLWAGQIDNSMGGQYYLQRYTLAVERDQRWEAAALSTFGATTVGSVGGTGAYGTVTGDSPGRLARITLNGTLTSGGPLTKLWLGWRTDRFGAKANFVPAWSLRLGSPFGADTTGGVTNADATAKDGYYVKTTFATTPALTQRVILSVAGVTANRSDQRGTFLVLLRARVSAINPAATVRVRLTDGLIQSKSMKARPRVPIVGTNTNWQFYEMGQIQIPSPGRVYSAVQLLDSYAVAIEAEQIGGGANNPSLHLDCLVLIPMAEGYLSVSIDPLAGQGVALNKNMQIFSLPDGGLQAMYFGGAGLTPQAILTPRLYAGLPVGAGLMVGAAQQDGTSVLADFFDVDLQTMRRWNTLRGSE